MTTRFFAATVRGWCLILMCLGAALRSGFAEESGVDFFESRIRPVLVERCYNCHSTGAAKIKGDLQLDSKEGLLRGGASGQPALVAGKPESSRLMLAIRYRDPDLQMPPKAEQRLSPQQIADFESWIAMGAPDPRTGKPAPARIEGSANIPWSFAPVRSQTPPPVRNERWIATPIDRFILGTLEHEGLEPSPEADRRTLIRRLSFDLHGLPPSLEDVEAFTRDRSPDAWERVVDRMLSSPRYGERWGRHWLDVARYADTKGYVYGDREETRFVHSHAYRDWVVRAHNEDLPFNRFLALQIAADQMTGEGPNPDLAAMGYLTLGKRFLGVVHDIVDDRIDVVMRGMQGLTVSCARCHDHKFDPISTRDYYSLYGIFSSSFEQLAPLRTLGGETSQEREALQTLRSKQEKLESTLQKKREALAERLRSQVGRYVESIPDTAKFPTEEFYEIRGTNDLNPVFVRRWAAFVERESAKGHPVFLAWKFFNSHAESTWPARGRALLETLTKEAKANRAVLNHLAKQPPSNRRELASAYGALFDQADRDWREVSANAAQPQSTLPDPAMEEIRQVFHGPGSPMAVPNGAVVEVEWFFDEPSRVELSKLQADIDKWLIQNAPSNALPHAVVLRDKADPKPGRVLRRGNPAQPGEETPPRLFEPLGNGRRFEQGSGRYELAQAIVRRENPLTARVFVNRVWAQHFGKGLVATPSDFGTRSSPPSHPELLDWMAGWFMDNGWSMKRLHKLILMSNTYRQSSTDRAQALALDPENRWLWRVDRRRLDWEALHDAMLLTSGELDARLGGFAVSAPVDGKVPRAIYQVIDRQFLPGLLRMFDFANPDTHSPSRPATTVPQQALFFINSRFAADRARAFAARSGLGENPASLFRQAFQRDPTPGESGKVRDFLTASKLTPKLAPPAPPPRDWQYGYGDPDPLAKDPATAFRPLPHFVKNSWQGGTAWPDPKLGWVRLTATGGHPGNTPTHAAIRRWTAPRDVTVRIEGKLTHDSDQGDGVRAWIVVKNLDVRGTWKVHHRSQEIAVPELKLRAGEFIDFAVDHGTTLGYDDFFWAPVIVEIGERALTQSPRWDAQKDFAGPPELFPEPFEPIEQLAQVILSSNEFLFVD